MGKEKQTVNVDLNPELWKKARAQAILDGKLVARWLSEAIELKLKEKK